MYNKYYFSITGQLTNALYLDYWNPYEYDSKMIFVNKYEICKINREYKKNNIIIYANNKKILTNIKKKCKQILKKDYKISHIKNN
jgi:hypothetical protein